MLFKTLCIIGTRPEAIKMAPIIKLLNTSPSIENKVCLTGQHKQMIDPILKNFGIIPDYNLDVMTQGQDLSSLTADILTKLESVVRQYKPNLVIVHGDTTTTLAASLSAYYHRVPIAHVEAGLRTGDINSPWPEEANRKITAALAQWHFAPTEQAKQNLLHERVPAHSIYVTGNSVIDALFEACNQLETTPELTRQLKEKFNYLSPKRKLILVTGHRRENFGEGFQRICKALATIAQLYPEIDIIYPVHLNPNVQHIVKSMLGVITNIHLIEPVDYIAFIHLMKTAYLIITDSGGIQEEAISLGKPVLVMRNNTERPEAITAGASKLIGTSINEIVNNVTQLLEDEQKYYQMSHVLNPYGNGSAAELIVNVITQIAA